MSGRYSDTNAATSPATEAIRTAAQELAAAIKNSGGDGRRMAVALTHLDTAVLWALAPIQIQ